MRRLPPVTGELIDRSQAVEFAFEGKPLRGYRGDTISSALAASGVRVLGRSFKYHRPRGLLSAAGHDANTLVQVQCGERSVPNVRGDVVPVDSDWRVSAVNTRGGLEHDRLAVLDHLSAFLPVGFYYKAFHSKRWFPRWERMFRRLSGLGEVDLRAEWTPAAEAASDTNGDHRGIGVSAGVAVGRARVATEELPTALLPGEILVAPVLDAALAPLLATAGGAVVEIGGILSHGSVVAREMGVPCVVDVRDATRTIRTGDLVMVETASGTTLRRLPTW